MIPLLSLPGAYPAFHPVGPGGEPDWLGEIFEWLSGADELSILEKDSVGRIPYERSVHGRFRLDLLIPYAAVAMAALNDRIRSKAGSSWPEGPLSPFESQGKCIFAATHDVDFIPVGRWQSVFRLIKNLGIASLLHRDATLAFAILLASARTILGGRSATHTLEPMLRREAKAGIRSTCNFIVRHGHRRDATYSTQDREVRRLLQLSSEYSYEVGLHGSYTSLDSPGRLAEEFQHLRSLGCRVVGGRQHWLKYFHHDQLMDELERAGACYDSTFGYSGHPGFRNGACFAYPPYNFSSETCRPLLELPLVLMDVSLYQPRAGRSKEEIQANQVLAAVRRWGWGGVSLLWHDSVFGGAQVPMRVAELYWSLQQPNDLWTSCHEIVEKVWPRFARAGIIPASAPGALDTAPESELRSE